jgi:predicted GNAT family acetyltransferase
MASAISATIHATAAAFLQEARIPLEREEAANSLMLGICLRMARQPERVAAPPFLATVSDPAGVMLAAMMTPPHKLVLAATRPDFAPAVEPLARALRAGGWAVPGVHARSETAAGFADAWVRATNHNYTIEHRERIYTLRQVAAWPPASGRLRLADQGDALLLTGWAEAFQAEALPGDPPQDFRSIVEQRIAGQALHVWEDGAPVSMAAVTRYTARGATVSLVYTPPHRRRRGYAGACVAHLSQHLLDAGWEYCALYTDLSNPTSNHIYQAIGYQPVCDIDEYLFVPTA